MKVSFVNITADPEQTMAYIARVSQIQVIKIMKIMQDY